MIDHLNEAENLMANAKVYVRHVDIDKGSLAFATMAQAEATIALVEKLDEFLKLLKESKYF